MSRKSSIRPWSDAHVKPFLLTPVKCGFPETPVCTTQHSTSGEKRTIMDEAGTRCRLKDKEFPQEFPRLSDHTYPHRIHSATRHYPVVTLFPISGFGLLPRLPTAQAAQTPAPKRERTFSSRLTPPYPSYTGSLRNFPSRPSQVLQCAVLASPMSVIWYIQGASIWPSNTLL